MKFALLASFAFLAFGCAAMAAENSPLDYKMDSIDGKAVDLSQYKGQVVMIVNVASKCGLTPQYEQLEAIYTKYRPQGFVILGFPANQFMSQEPGTNAEIATFCTEKYNVDFPMFSKIVVKGEGMSPLYQLLTKLDTEPAKAGDISWNFEKFLVDRSGKVVKRFAPRTKPDAPEVTTAIEAELRKIGS